VVAQPWRRAGKLDITSGSCVAPLRLRGLRGKQSTPSDWLGGTGEVSTVGKQDRHGTTDDQEQAFRKRYAFWLNDRRMKDLCLGSG
jgi:hypothetical protein